MKPAELKQEYIKLRAEGRAYSYIADKLHISKSTCTKWEKELEADIAQANRESLILSNLLKAYETVEVKAKLEKLEAIVGGR